LTEKIKIWERRTERNSNREKEGVTEREREREEDRKREREGVRLNQETNILFLS
jgi:hypothetical protein